MAKYDVILVLGRGVYQDGSIPDSAIATIKTAVDLYNQGKAPRILFSGKWTYRLKEIPPLTEAEAMANYAKSLGLPDSAIFVEKESISTITNICNIKRNFLIPNNWHNVILVSLDPVHKRAFHYLKRILGADYTYELTIAPFTFPEDKYHSLKESEEQKIKSGDTMLKHIPDGDERAFYQHDIEYIKKHNPSALI